MGATKTKFVVKVSFCYLDRDLRIKRANGYMDVVSQQFSTLSGILEARLEADKIGNK